MPQPITHTEPCGCVYEIIGRLHPGNLAIIGPCPDHCQDELAPSHYDRSINELDAGW